MPHPYSSYVAIGDSFTEGVGDDLPDGRVRGWADLVAIGLATASAGPVGYANLAIRGRLLAPIVAEQLDAAIALSPALLSLNGGGNDILRPRVAISSIAEQIMTAVDRASEGGCHVLLVSGANPTRHIPLGSVFQQRGDLLDDAIRERLPRDGVTFVDNWADPELTDIRFWSRDKLHLNALGHTRVAGSVLAGLGVPVPDAAADEATGDSAEDATGDPTEVRRQGSAQYWREYVLPWVGRRLTGRSSGDRREPKSATLVPVELP